MNFIIRKIEYKVISSKKYKNYYFVENVNPFNIGDYVLGVGAIDENNIESINYGKKYFMVSKKSNSVLYGGQDGDICRGGYFGRIYKANYVQAIKVK